MTDEDYPIKEYESIKNPSIHCDPKDYEQFNFHGKKIIKNRVDFFQRVGFPAKEKKLYIEELKKEITLINPNYKEPEAEEESFLESPDLMLRIHEEISKKHLKDDAIKLTEFLIWCTAYLYPASLHKSLAKKGSSAVGKDNISNTLKELFPEEDVLFLTNATQAVLEDDIDTFKIVVYSEVNLGRKDDKGANSHLLEAIKQMTEGGMSSMKKDAGTGYKTLRHSKQEQKSVIYGTTESASDEELATRFIVGSVSASPDKIKCVNNNTLKWFSGIREENKDQWFSYAVKNLFTHNQVVIPFLNDLPENFFDCSDPRSMRDCKRFLACVCAVAWVHQLQRQIDQENRIIAELSDFLMAMIITGHLFNYTYTGLGDERLRKFIDAMNEYCDHENKSSDLFQEDKNIFPRHKIQEKLDITINTIKGLVKGCQDLSVIRFHHKDNSIIYYERCQKGVKRVLIGYTWFDIKDYFEQQKGVKIPQRAYDTLLNIDNLCKKGVLVSSLEEIDTLKLTPPGKQGVNPGEEVGEELDIETIKPENFGI